MTRQASSVVSQYIYIGCDPRHPLGWYRLGCMYDCVYIVVCSILGAHYVLAYSCGLNVSGTSNEHGNVKVWLYTFMNNFCDLAPVMIIWFLDDYILKHMRFLDLVIWK